MRRAVFEWVLFDQAVSELAVSERAVFGWAAGLLSCRTTAGDHFLS